MSRIRTNREEFERKLREKLLQDMQKRGPRAAAIVLQQIKRRFDNGGDPDRPWEPLWASDDAAVRRATEGTGTDRLRAFEASEARRKRKDAIQKEAKPSRRRKLRNEARIKAEQARTGNPSYRRGGKPLLDTGLLRNSMVTRAKWKTSPRGWTATRSVSRPWT